MATGPTPLNWSSGGTPAAGETNMSLVFPSGGANRHCTNDLAGLAVKSVTIHDNYWLDGHFTLTLLNNGIGASLLCSGTNCTIGMPLDLTSPALGFTVGASAHLYLACVISGSGGFTKFGAGELWLEGNPANTYQGTTTVSDGVLWLSKGATWFDYNTIAMLGPLIVGSTDMTRHPAVRIFYSEQLTNNPVTINPNGTFDTQGYDASIGTLTMNGGTVNLSGYADYSGPFYHGTLNVKNALTSMPTALSEAVIVGGGVSLFGNSPADHPVVNVTGGNLFIGGEFGGVAADWTKLGDGTLILAPTNNALSGAVSGAGIIQQGAVCVTSSNAIFTDSLTVSNGGQLLLNAAATAIGDLHLNGFGTNGLGGALLVTGDGARWSGGLVLDSDAAIEVANAADRITFGSATATNSGAGNLTKIGPGIVRFADCKTNLMTGEVRVDRGTIELNGTNSLTFVSTPITVGHQTADGTTAELKWLASWRLPSDLPMTIRATGTLNLNGFHETLGALTLMGGDVETYGGVLHLSGDVLATNAVGSMIHGSLSLGSTNRVFHVAPNNTLTIFAQVSDAGPSGAGFDLDGDGTLSLYGPNTFLGPINVKAGLLYARNNGALGSFTGGTIVWPGARLAADGRDFGLEPISLNGDGNGYGALTGSKTNTFAGPITLATDSVVNAPGAADRILFSGAISGPGGLTKIGSGTIQFAGAQANTYAGATTVSEGILELYKNSNIAVPGPLIVGDDFSPAGSAVVRTIAAGQFATNAPATLNASALLDLAFLFSGQQALGSLSGKGTFQLGLNTLTVGGDNSDAIFVGKITGLAASGIVKAGAGKWRLSSYADQFLGSVLVNGGVLEMVGTVPSAHFTIAAGGRMTGNGLSGDVFDAGGILRPGGENLASQVLACQNLSLDSGSIFELHLAGTNEVSNVSRMDVTGTVNLGDATLDAKLGFNASGSNQFLIIQNDGNDAVIGTFKNLAEGGEFTLYGAQFQITYQGGDGNDVVLTQLSDTAPPQLDAIEQQSGGSMKLSGAGIPGAPYDIVANATLTSTNWYLLSTVNADTNGVISFIDLNATNYPQRFYRFRTK